MKNTFTPFLLLAAVAFTSASNAQTKVTVFDQSETRYRIPSIVKLQNGNLMAFCDKRYNNTGDLGSGVADIVAKTSTDNGSTWGSMTTPLKGDGNTSSYTYAYGDAATVADRETGEVLILSGCGKQGMSGSTQQNPCRMMRAVSSDNGQTWSSSELTSTIYALCSDFTGVFFTSGKICQSSRIKVGSHYRIYSALASFNVGAVVAYSDDFGLTWSLLGGSAARPGMSGSTVCSSESKLEELPDGNVLMSCRGGSGNQNGRWYNLFTYSDAESASGSWGSITQSAYTTSNSDQVKGGQGDGEVLLVPAKDANGNDVYVLLQSADYPANCGIWISYKAISASIDYDSPQDFISGWSFYQVSSETSKSKYSTMVLDKNGDVALLYEENATTNSYDIQFMSLSLSTITGGTYTNDGSEYVAAPSFSPAGGTYTEAQSVSLSSLTEGAAIYYTTDGSNPTSLSNLYSEPIVVSETTTINAIAIKEGVKSLVSTATYIISAANGDDFEENAEPIDGGVYTIYAQRTTTDSPLYVYNNNGTLAVSSVSATTDVAATDSYLWVCQRASDGSHYFSSLDGEGYLGLNSKEMAAYVTDYSSALKIVAFQKEAVSSGSYTGTAMTGYALGYTQGGSTAYVCVNGSGTFDRLRITTNSLGTTGYTTDFIFNHVPFSSSSSDYGTLGAPVHHGANVLFARNEDEVAEAKTADDYHDYATLCLPYSVSLPSGVTAYSINGLSPVSGSKVQLEQYLVGGEGVTLPRETPVLLQTDGEKGDGMPTRTLYFKPATAEESVETGFAGTLGRKVLSDNNASTGSEDGSIYYILAKKDGRVAFYYLEGNASGEMAIGNNKAYYIYSGTSAAKPSALSFSFGDETTGVGGIKEAASSNGESFYDLSGRRVSSPSKGVYIRGGKKFVIR